MISSTTSSACFSSFAPPLPSPAPTPDPPKAGDELHSFIVERTTASVPGWSQLTAADINVSELKGGMTNKLFKVSLLHNNNGSKHDASTPQAVVVRFFGSVGSALLDRENENIVTSTLSQSGIGVPIYDCFNDLDGGRIERFLNGRSLTHRELAQPSIATCIARKMAAFHSLEIAVSHQPHFSRCLPLWIQAARSLQPSSLNISFDDLQKQADWLTDCFQKLQSPVVFCHNDLQEGNIIFDQDTRELYFIDYEYAGYNYRGFDIGNHFCEHIFEYGVKKRPYFGIDESLYPSKEQQLQFCRDYLSSTLSWADSKLTDQVSESSSQDVSKQESMLYQEAQYGMLASHLMWTVWSLIKATQQPTSELEPSCRFDFAAYAGARWKEFKRLKDSLKL